MQSRIALTALILPFAVFSVLGGQKEVSNQKKNGVYKESEAETLWRGRYADCDFGLILMLPKGFVGHGGPSSNPGHGFLVGLPDPTLVQPVSAEDPRVIYVSAEHNSLEIPSLSGVVDYEIDLIGRQKEGFTVVERNAATLNKHPATRFRVEYKSSNGVIVEEELIALRAGLIYEIGLRTTKSSYSGDEALFQRVKTGFTFWRIHSC